MTTPAYAVVRVDSSRTTAAYALDADISDAWRALVQIEALVSTREEAEREVHRLSDANRNADTIYFWQYTSREAQQRETKTSEPSREDDINEWSEM